MEEWPAWQRWAVWLSGCALYGGAFVLLFAATGVALRVVALLGICAGAVVLTYASHAVLNERVRKIDRWQLYVVLPAILVYIVLVMYVAPQEARVTVPWLKALITLSPMLPMLLVAWAMVRYVNRCDELERRQHLEAAGIAVIVVSLVCMGLGLLGAARLITANGTLVLLLVFPALCSVYGSVCVWSKWRNRAR